MNPKSRRISALALAYCALSVATARAHPGHDGHELTWDLRHLGEHPVATLLWLGVAAGVACCGWLLLKRAVNQRFYNFRGSQPSRGK